jgi:hypothetical protein
MLIRCRLQNFPLTVKKEFGFGKWIILEPGGVSYVQFMYSRCDSDWNGVVPWDMDIVPCNRKMVH